MKVYSAAQRFGLGLWSTALVLNVALWAGLGEQLPPELSGPLLLGPALLLNFPVGLLPLWLFGGLVGLTGAAGATATVLGGLLYLSAYGLGYWQWFFVVPRLARSVRLRFWSCLSESRDETSGPRDG